MALYIVECARKAAEIEQDGRSCTTKVAWRACAGGVCVCVCVNVWDEGFKGMLDGPRVCVVVGMLYTMCFGAFGAGCVTASCRSEVLL